MKDGDIKIVGLSNPKSGKTKWKVIGAIIGIIVLFGSVIAGILLVRQNQNIEEKAACTASCVNGSSLLVNCYGAGTDNDGDQMLCNLKGRVEVCGATVTDSKQFCCPAAGGSWTTDLTKCPTVTASPTTTATATVTSTPTATATAITTSTARATATATSKATATVTAKPTSTVKATTSGSATATAVPVPVTGASFPTILGLGFGVVMILASIVLAL